jgi:acyl carrier protein|tara:strand:+ start:352 stop:609 length:258 start_codon:yes stop_codon:yes gene_type:complete
MNRHEVLHSIKEEVDKHIRNPNYEVDDDIFLKNGGVLDSFSMLTIALYLENKYSLELATFFEDREQVSSINKLTDYIVSKDHDVQ